LVGGLLIDDLPLPLLRSVDPHCFNVIGSWRRRTLGALWRTLSLVYRPKISVNIHCHGPTWRFFLEKKVCSLSSIVITADPHPLRAPL
jgi:hypothetical protein